MEWQDGRTSAREVSFWAYGVGQDPSDSKSSRLHVDIFRFFCFHSFEVNSINSSKIIGNPPKVSNFNRLCSEMTLNYWMMVDKIPTSQGRGWRFDSRLWNLLSTWHKLARWSTASCALVLACRPSISKKKKKLQPVISQTQLVHLQPTATSSRT